MASYKLTYFQGRGGGEVVRLTFVVAGQKFEDERLPFEEWPDRKPKCPYKCLPTLTVKKDGKEYVYCQSGSMAKYLAKQFGLFGSSPEENFLIDEIYECVMDIFRDSYRAHFNKSEDAKKEGIKKFEEVDLPKFAAYFDLRRKEHGENGFLIGPKITVADIMTFAFMDNLKGVGYDTVWEPYPTLEEHYQLIKSNEKIAAYLLERPVSEF